MADTTMVESMIGQFEFPLTTYNQLNLSTFTPSELIDSVVFGWVRVSDISRVMKKPRAQRQEEVNLLALSPCKNIASIKEIQLPRTCSICPPQARTVCVPGSLGPHTLGTRIGS